MRNRTMVSQQYFVYPLICMAFARVIGILVNRMFYHQEPISISPLEEGQR
jgi:Na+/proline symporter